MSPRLVNVRLDDERARKVRELQAEGISLSDVVREAIDQRYGALRDRGEEDLEAVIRRIHEMYPDPPDTPPRDYDVHDRRQARAAILRKLNPERS
jgi:hypothetical protein